MRNRRIATFLSGCLAALIALICTIPVIAKSPAADGKQTNTPTVRVIYLVPNDRDYRKDYADALARAASSVQLWYLLQIPGVTFALDKKPVTVVHTDHPAAWYANTPNGDWDYAFWFWFNTTTEGLARTGGTFFDQKHVWIFYIDADPGCGQTTGGVASVALMPANDLRGFIGERNEPACAWEGPDPDQYKVCRWIGGLGHELGHAVGLDHPAVVDDTNYYTLMWMGYRRYPDTYLLPENKDVLRSTPFFLPARASGGAKTNFSCDGKPVKPKVFGPN